MATIRIARTIMVPMRDGVHLATDVYRLDGAAPAPVLLTRTPYDKEHTLRGGNCLMRRLPICCTSNRNFHRYHRTNGARLQEVCLAGVRMLLGLRPHSYDLRHVRMTVPAVTHLTFPANSGVSEE